jgi:hypothetical protein
MDLQEICPEFTPLYPPFVRGEEFTTSPAIEACG